jgi:hypothetical protein
MAYGGLNQPLCNITFFQQENVIVWKKLKQNRIEESLPIGLHGQYTVQVKKPLIVAFAVFV